MKLIGIDGCRAGWVVVTADESLSWLDFAVAPTITPVVDLVAHAGTLAVIDIPIGLPDSGPRACDMAARDVLGRPRNSSVFPAPCRAALQAASYEEACERNAKASGKRVSRQLYGILPKIREVDAAISPALQASLREAHPEVTFAALARTGRGPEHAKRTPDGEAERLALLRGIVPRFDLAREHARLGPARVARNDIVDAVACLATAYRTTREAALVLPRGHVPLDGRGLRMEIVA